MKLLIISAGPGINQIRGQYGHATDWISNLVTSSNIKIDINNIYLNEDFNEFSYDGWIITGSSSSIGWAETAEGLTTSIINSSFILSMFSDEINFSISFSFPLSLSIFASSYSL